MPSPFVHILLHFTCIGRSVRVMSRIEVELPPLLGPDAWIRVSGGHLPQPVDVKVRVRGTGTAAVVALRMDNEADVTSRQLRDVRLPEIASAVLAELVRRVTALEERVEDHRRDSAASAQDSLDRLAALGYSVTGSRLRELRSEEEVDEAYAVEQDEAYAVELRTHLAAIAPSSSTLEKSARGRGANAPTDDDYGTFARVFLEESLRAVDGAVPRTAKRLHMSRSNAYRWLETCRRTGLVPPRGANQ